MGSLSLLVAVACILSLVRQGFAETLGYSLDPTGIRLDDDRVTGKVYVISTKWTFQSNRTFINKWKIYNARPGESLIFQLWHHDSVIVEGQVAVFRLLAASQTFTTTSGAYDEFVQDPPMAANNGDLVAIAFPGRNPVPYRETGSCAEKFWMISSPTNVTVNSRFTGTVGTCRQYLIQAEYQVQPLDPSVQVRMFGSAVIPRRTLSDDTDGIIIENPTMRLPKRSRVIGWKAYMARANTKVRFVAVRRSEISPGATPYSYFITHESNDYSLREPGILTAYYSSEEFPLYIEQGDLIGIMYSDTNPIPYDTVQCENSERALSIPSLESLRKVQEFTQDTTDRLCRKFSFALMYKDEAIETTKRVIPTTTSVPTPKPGSTVKATFARPCQVLTLKKDTSGEERSDDFDSSSPLPERQCWRLSVDSFDYVIKVEVLDLELGDCPDADKVDIRDGESDIADALVENVCSGNFDCVSCSNKMYLRVRTTSKRDAKGIRFRYSVIPKGRYIKCGRVTKSDLTPERSNPGVGGGQTGSVSRGYPAFLLFLFLPLVAAILARL